LHVIDEIWLGEMKIYVNARVNVRLFILNNKLIQQYVIKFGLEVELFLCLMPWYIYICQIGSLGPYIEGFWSNGSIKGVVS
jgi:hypothetical protein